MHPIRKRIFKHITGNEKENRIVFFLEIAREREFFSAKGLIQLVEDSTAIRNYHYLRETLYVHIVQLSHETHDDMMAK